MVNVVVIGDDLTGSNATGSLYARQGLKAVTVSTLDSARLVADDVDVLVFTTESRHLPAADAAARVRDIVDLVGPWGAQVAKRVDTTLRGNVGAESWAALTSLREAFPRRRTVALVVPAFPTSGRTTVGGLQLVEGLPVDRSWAARDPFTPVLDASVARLLATQSPGTTAEIDLHELGDDLPRRLRDAAATADFVVCDALDAADLDTIATAAAEVRGDDLDWLVVDTGPFGAAYAAARGLRAETAERAPEPLVLALIGSLTEQTDQQVAHLLDNENAELLTVHPDSLSPAQVVDGLAALAAKGRTIVGVRVESPGDAPVTAAAAERVLAYLRAIAAAAVERLPLAGVYATGGDVARQTIDTLGAYGFRIDEEVLPLAVSGAFVGGPHDGLGFATKGGLIGGPDAAAACIRALQTKALAAATRDLPHDIIR